MRARARRKLERNHLESDTRRCSDLRPPLIIHARIITAARHITPVGLVELPLDRPEADDILRSLFAAHVPCPVRCASRKGIRPFDRVLRSVNVPLSSAGLFHRVVLSSGSALSPWASVHDPNDLRLKIGEQMGCSTDGDNDIADCLRRVPLKTLMDVQLPEIR